MLKREKKYQIKAISNDGLLKDVVRYGYNGYEVIYDDYDTEEEAWAAIERQWQSDFGHVNDPSRWCSTQVTVVELWVVRPEEED